MNAMPLCLCVVVVLCSDVCHVRCVSHILVHPLLLLLQGLASCAVLDCSCHLHRSVLCWITVIVSDY